MTNPAKDAAPADLVEPVVKIATDAGAAILEVYETDFRVDAKDDASPLTQADMASHHRIVDGLTALAPDVPVLSEEGGLPAFEQRCRWRRYWLIDPLDGTKEFIKKNGEFTVNIALIDDHRPVLGVVHIPVKQRTYVGCEGMGAECRTAAGARTPIRVAIESASPVDRKSVV